MLQVRRKINCKIQIKVVIVLLCITVIMYTQEYIYIRSYIYIYIYSNASFESSKLDSIVTELTTGYVSD